MGRAVILSNKGGGFYSIRPLFNTSRIELELERIEQESAQHATLLAAAWITLWQLQRERAEAEEGLNAVIEQWRSGALNPGETLEPLPPFPPEDPGTGLPWEDPDRAQDKPFWDALQAARAGAGRDPLDRQAALDGAALRIVRHGWDPLTAVVAAGYHYAEVAHQIALGVTTPEAAVSQLRDQAALSDAYAEGGVAYHSDARSPYYHHWCVVIANPGTKIETKLRDPAEQAADDATTELERIEPPRLDSLQPAQIQDAIIAYRIAAQRVTAARQEIDRMIAEESARKQHKDLLEGILTELEIMEIDAWHCRWIIDLKSGDEVQTAEVPGWLDRPGRDATRTIDGAAEFYIERDINIVERAPGLGAPGTLAPAEAATDSGVFVNAALEPGHQRWSPEYRYGIVTAVTRAQDPTTGGWFDYCDVTLDPATARQLPGEPPLPLGPASQLAAVQFNYCTAVIAVGDQVLIHFADRNPSNPRILGWRRSPKPCLSGRQSWAQYR